MKSYRKITCLARIMNVLQELSQDGVHNKKE